LENNNTDIALIKRDIKQIEKFFAKVELAMESLQDMAKTAAVQDETLKNTKEHIEFLDDLMERHRKEDEKRVELIANRLEEYRKSTREDHQRLADHSARNRTKRNEEIMEALNEMALKMDKQMAEHNKRINVLENWKYYMMGVGAVIVVLIAKISWPEIFS
jgi:hypothetical protein